MLLQLFGRYELPNAMNRWDAPLFPLDPQMTELPLQQIVDHLFKSSLATPNLATLPVYISWIGIFVILY